MANLEKSKESVPVTIESSVAEPIAVGKFKADADDKDEVDVDIDLDALLDDEESDNDVDSEVPQDESDDSEEDTEPEEAVVAVTPKTKEQKKISALKNEAKKLQLEKAELERKLREREEAKAQQAKETELAAQYVEEGYDEKEAKKLAKDSVRQSSIERELEILRFERLNRRVLTQYPQAENDLETIVDMAKLGKMSVEQICRGLYGVEVPAKERRATDALLDRIPPQEQNTTVSRAVNTATTPAKSKLTERQKQYKRLLEKQVKHTMTDEQFLLSWNG